MSGILAPTLALRNSAGAQLALDDDGGDGLNSRLQFRATTTGTYYLDLDGFGSSTGAYVAQAREVPATTATYSSLTPGGSTTGDLHAAGDHDWTAISLTAGTAYTFELRGSATGGGTLVDPELFLRNSTGTVLTSDDDGGVGLDSLITFTPTASGTYFLDAGEFGNNAAGSHTLSAAGTGGGGGAFDVVINYTGDPSSSGEFTSASLRWRTPSPAICRMWQRRLSAPSTIRRSKRASWPSTGRAGLSARRPGTGKEAQLTEGCPITASCSSTPPTLRTSSRKAPSTT
jgi:hypothetical protein